MPLQELVNLNYAVTFIAFLFAISSDSLLDGSEYYFGGRWQALNFTESCVDPSAEVYNLPVCRFIPWPNELRLLTLEIRKKLSSFLMMLCYFYTRLANFLAGAFFMIFLRNRSEALNPWSFQLVRIVWLWYSLILNT